MQVEPKLPTIFSEEYAKIKRYEDKRIKTRKKAIEKERNVELLLQNFPTKEISQENIFVKENQSKNRKSKLNSRTKENKHVENGNSENDSSSSISLLILISDDEIDFPIKKQKKI